MCISVYGYVCMNVGRPWRLEERARSSAAGVIGGSRLPNVGAGNYPEILCQSVTPLNLCAISPGPGETRLSPLPNHTHATYCLNKMANVLYDITGSAEALSYRQFIFAIPEGWILFCA